MTERLLKNVKQWFNDYYQKFINIPNLSHDDIDALKLKFAHSYRVMKEIENIASALVDRYQLTQSDIIEAKIIGLLHDVARFSQYTKYHTMNDALSEDHGDLGAEIIQDMVFIQELPRYLQTEIIKAVAGHNKIKIPEKVNLTQRELLFTQMIRDADKLDVFHLACPIYRDYPNELGERLKLHLPSQGIPSPEVIEAFLGRIPIPFSKIRNMTDFKVLQMAWLFDFNFPVSVKICYERRYLHIIYETLPDFQEKEHIWAEISSFVAKKVKDFN